MTVPAQSRQSLWKRIRKGDGEEIQSPTTTVSRRSVAAEDWLSTYCGFLATLVAIQLEDSDMPFAVHKALLREQSQWFADRLGKDELEIHLAKVPTPTFRLFTAWLYAGKLVHPSIALNSPSTEATQLDDTDDTHDEEPTWSDIDLVHLYYFAAHHRVRRLGNDILTAFHHSHFRTRSLTSESAIRLLWATCGANTALSRFILQERALYGMTSRDNVPAYFQSMPSSFLAGVIRAAASLHAQRSRGHDITTLPSACHWHDHAEDMEEKIVCRQRLAMSRVTSHAGSSRPYTATSTSKQPSTRLSIASTAVQSKKSETKKSEAWKHDSAMFHPLYIVPEYPTSAPPAYSAKDVALSRREEKPLSKREEKPLSKSFERRGEIKRREDVVSSTSYEERSERVKRRGRGDGG